jgi:hypothetical protein
MSALVLSFLVSLSAHASVSDGHLVNPQVHGHGFLAVTAEETGAPGHSPEEIAYLEQQRADAVCNYLASPRGLFFTRHAAEFDPGSSFTRGQFAVVTFNDQNQTWSASLVPLEAFSFASIHCLGD